MSEKLKPCPFCGGEVELVKQESGEFKFVLVSCKNCNATIGIGGSDNEKKVTKAWNTRPNPWHTGTPTEEGNYLLRLRHANMKFDTVTFRNGKFMSYHNHRHDPEDIIKWQKIEPYEDDA